MAYPLSTKASLQPSQQPPCAHHHAGYPTHLPLSHPFCWHRICMHSAQYDITIFNMTSNIWIPVRIVMVLLPVFLNELHLVEVAAKLLTAFLNCVRSTIDVSKIDHTRFSTVLPDKVLCDVWQTRPCNLCWGLFESAWTSTCRWL